MEMKSKKLVLTRGKTLDFQEKLSNAQDEVFQTLYLPPNLPSDVLESEFKGLNLLSDVSRKITDIFDRSTTGAIILHSAHQTYLIVPPFPVTEKSASQSLDTAPLQSLLNRQYRIGIILVRLGSYAVGLCRGDKLVNSKVGTGLIHGRHHKGGSSAHRFERHRDKQIESFLIRVCGHVREQLEQHIKTLDYIIYGGARTTILSLQKHCPLLEKIEKPTLPTLLDIPEPRRAVLESAISHIWSSTVYSWTEN